MMRLYDLRVVQVKTVQHLTPRMRRITLHGPELENFHSGTHLKLLIPPYGITPEWPTQDETGKPLWPEEKVRPTMRTYTLRHFRPEQQEIDIDMVLHGKGIASQWAEGAKVGETVGIIPPGKGSTYTKPAPHYLLAGDHCTLPALMVTLENLPEGSSAEVFMLLPDAQEIQPIHTRADVQIHWLLQDRGQTQQDLIRQVKRASFPEGTFLWAAGESTLVKALREHGLQKGLTPERAYVLGYWKQDMNETRYSSELRYDL